MQKARETLLVQNWMEGEGRSVVVLGKHYLQLYPHHVLAFTHKCGGSTHIRDLIQTMIQQKKGRKGVTDRRLEGGDFPTWIRGSNKNVEGGRGSKRAGHLNEIIQM